MRQSRHEVDEINYEDRILTMKEQSWICQINFEVWKLVNCDLWCQKLHLDPVKRVE